MKSSVISARIPHTIKLELDALLSKSGLSTSEFIQQSVSQQMAQKAITSGVVVSAVSSASTIAKRTNVIPQMKVDNELADVLLSVGGGSAIGLAVYLIVKHVIEEYYPERTDANDIASISGIAVGMGSTLALLTRSK